MGIKKTNITSPRDASTDACKSKDQRFFRENITTGNLGPYQPEGWVDKQKTELQTNYRLLVSTLNGLENHSMKIF